MKKDFTRDYVTEAFRLYAIMGRPTYEAARKKLYEEELSRYNLSHIEDSFLREEVLMKNKEAMWLDILAVNRMIELLRQGGKSYIVNAVEEVYFVQPLMPLRKGDITARARRFSLSFPTDERTVYRWLREARLLCAGIRGLRITETDVKKYHIAL